MSPEDPRHGTEAGRAAHRREGESPCLPCRVAGSRADKRRRVQGPGLVRLGEAAWHKVETTPLHQLVRASGVSECALQNMTGPDSRVRPATRNRIIAAQVVTEIGLARRVRALTALGWTARDIARLAGINVDHVLKLRNRGEMRRYVRKDVQERFLRVYAELHMTPAPPSRWSTTARHLATKKGWVAPLAWDEETIDNPAALPEVGPHETDIDPVVVMRLLEGQRVKATTAEREAALVRWVADGGSESELCRWHGWRPGRYSVGLRMVRGEAS